MGSEHSRLGTVDTRGEEEGGPERAESPIT
jgi:hypothetical protein